jgi:DNA-binding CsgD family transcriptional regulator
MTRVSAQDFRGIHRFLEGAYDAAAAGSPDRNVARGALPRQVLLDLETLIGADFVASFQVWRGVFDDAPVTTSRDDEGPLIIGAFAGRGGINPIRAFAFSAADPPQRLSGLLSQRRLKKLPMYLEYLEPTGIQDQLKVWLWSSANSAACVSLDRTDGMFGDRDVAVLAVVQQHLATMRESLMSASDQRAGQPVEALTVREAQVLSWAARGRQNREIAELLYISPATVRKHLEHAYAKLGARNRTEAVAALRESATGIFSGLAPEGVDLTERPPRRAPR